MKHLCALVLMACLLGGCAAFSEWAATNPDEAENAAVGVENVGHAVGGAVTLTGPYGWLAAPFILAATGIAAKLIRDSKRNADASTSPPPTIPTNIGDPQ